MGRRRAIPELNAPNEQVKRLGNRLAVNTPIQGAAADIMKVAMLNVDKALLDSGLNSTILLQIHDELLLECPIDESEKVKKLLIKELENAHKLTVPLTVNVLEGKSWNMAKYIFRCLNSAC